MATWDDVVFGRVVGLGTMSNSIPFKRFLDESQERGFRKFVFDLSECEGFDSTFMGILLSIALAEGRVVLVNLKGPHRKLLADVGIHRLVQLCDGPVGFPEVTMQELEVQPVDTRTRFRHVLGAHESLVRADRRNEAKFGAFLELLRKELGDRSPL